MDAVPYVFVDSVVELFYGEKTLDRLAREVQNPLWKTVVDVHHRNREYYYVYVRMTEGGTQLIAQKKGDYIFDNFGNLKILDVSSGLLKSRRFVRIVTIDDWTWVNSPEIEDFQVLGEAEAAKQLRAIAPQFEQGSLLAVARGTLDILRIILPSLFSFVRLGTIYLDSDGQITLDFLEDQINNSPYLTTVGIKGDKWPKSVLPLLESFCLKGRPGKRFSLSITETTVKLIDINFTQKLFDHWKADGNLNLYILFAEEAMDSAECQALWDQGEVVETETDKFCSFKHETKKSIVLFQKSFNTWFLQFLSCECDLSGRCSMKEIYPNFHRF